MAHAQVSACERGLGDEHSVLAKPLGIQGEGVLICIVKARRRQAAGRPNVTNDEDPVMGTVTWGSKKNLQPDGPPDQAPPAEKGPLSGEQQELYYANLTFEGLKPREPRDQEATSTHEYSEVKRAGQ
ncbi:PREDICTED: sialic acid-binding Ig-like lectin 5 [Myotis brandtii]|uniref:sialic acid-binding Ig-like lectin 5 n=1 Tax=Myotis brandtii TaxID=109478 RepID=UPI0007045034|nr:PREDICTED: sialic acid-binding Ig-like lectin 5 [Myotis brandtii]